MLRMMWFIDFLIDMYYHVYSSNMKISLGKACGLSYDKNLGIHHPWAIRTAVKAGLLAPPYSETLIKIHFGFNLNFYY